MLGLPLIRAAAAALGAAACAWAAAAPAGYDPKDPPESVAWYADARLEVERVFGLLTDALRLSGDLKGGAKLVWDEKGILAAWRSGARGPGPAVTFPPSILDSTRGEDELAFLLAHELAHVRFRHPERRETLGSDEAFAEYKGRRSREPAFAGLGEEAKLDAFLEEVLRPAFKVQEDNADFFGLLYMHGAGFDCRRAGAVFAHFAEAEWAVAGGELAAYKRWALSAKRDAYRPHDERRRRLDDLCADLRAK